MGEGEIGLLERFGHGSLFSRKRTSGAPWSTVQGCALYHLLGPADPSQQTECVTVRLHDGNTLCCLSAVRLRGDVGVSALTMLTGSPVR